MLTTLEVSKGKWFNNLKLKPNWKTWLKNEFLQYEIIHRSSSFAFLEVLWGPSSYISSRETCILKTEGVWVPTIMK